MNRRLSKILRAAFGVSVVLAVTGCMDNILPHRGPDGGQEEIEGVVMRSGRIVFDDSCDTRVTAQPSDAGIDFAWSQGDAVGVFTGQSGFARFTLASGDASASALFDGDGFTLTPGNTYYAMFPYDGTLTDRTAIPVDYTNRCINGLDSVNDMVANDPMVATATARDNGSALFDFNHLSSFARFRFTVGDVKSFNTLELIPTFGNVITSLKYDLTDGSSADVTTTRFLKIPMSNVSSSATDRELTLWASFAPQDFSRHAIAAVMYDADGNIYTARLDGKNLRQGKAYRWDAEMVKYSDKASSGFSVTKMNPVAIDSWTDSGQYSGITKVSDSRYAVVHDKYKGGGLTYFDMKFNDYGMVTSVKQTTPEGTSLSSAVRDPEGIVYLPSLKTFFISGENDQAIIEYDTLGNPLSRRLNIPEDMTSKGIQEGAGFESLAYNASTGLFWTTTEMPLALDDGQSPLSGRKLLRLQSFKSDLNPGERYLYLMDKPQMTSSGTYVHGVSDILALDDGRLVVVEREVKVDFANISLSTLNQLATVYAKLYVVDPVNDGGGILSKAHLITLDTYALSMANYEGICLGPRTKSGKQTILLINDSQGRMSKSVAGLTVSLKDYITTLVID